MSRKYRFIIHSDLCAHVCNRNNGDPSAVAHRRRSKISSSLADLASEWLRKRTASCKADFCPCNDTEIVRPVSRDLHKTGMILRPLTTQHKVQRLLQSCTAAPYIPLEPHSKLKLRLPPVLTRRALDQKVCHDDCFESRCHIRAASKRVTATFFPRLVRL